MKRIISLTVALFYAMLTVMSGLVVSAQDTVTITIENQFNGCITASFSDGNDEYFEYEDGKTFEVPIGTRVEFCAVPFSGYSFFSWTGDLSECGQYDDVRWTVENDMVIGAEWVSKSSASGGGGGPATTGKFYFKRDGKNVQVSFNGFADNFDCASNMIIGAYDNGVLVKSEVIEIDSAVYEYSLEPFNMELPEEPQNFELKSFLWSADGDCEPYCEASELTSVPVDAYVCYGRVMGNSRGSHGLVQDEVTFRVERSDDFNGDEIYDYNSRAYCMKIGNTDLNDPRYLFRYIKAYVIYDELADEYTILDYTTDVGNENIAVDMLLSDVTFGDDGTPIFGEYEISDDAELYVNGVKIWVVNDISEYIAINRYEDAKVTLVDATLSGSTEGDGVYDYVFAECYGYAVVDAVAGDEETAKVYFSEWSDDLEAKMVVDLTDEDYCVNITDSNGNTSKSSADLTQLKEGDALYIAYDFNSGFYCSEFFDIITDGELEQEQMQTPEFAINNVISGVCAVVNDGNLCVGGNLTIDRTTVDKPLSAVINVYDADELVFTRTVNVPAQMNRLSLNEVEEFSGTAESAEIVFTDGETVYYTVDVPVTDAFAVYSVRGRVVGTSKTDSSLAENQVIITAESHDETEELELYTDVEFDVMYEYCQFSIAEYDDGTEKIIKAEPLTDNTVTFPTNMVSDEFNIIDYERIPVYTSEESIKTVKYDLNYDFALYVNGVECASTWDNREAMQTYLEEYIYNNPTGQVTLVDSTFVASTASDGDYDYIFVTYTGSAVVDRLWDGQVYFKTYSNDVTGAWDIY